MPSPASPAHARAAATLLLSLTLPCVASVVMSAAAHAQAPVITSQGDPSVSNDTIYSLVVDPADHPDESTVILLDDGVLRYEADGTGTRTFRYVVQILKDDAVEGWSEHSFGFAPDHEKLTINWIRVLRPDGTVISKEPTLVQESDVPAAMRSPIYTERRVIRASLSGVAPGTIVDYSYTREELKPYRTGDFHQFWLVSMGTQVQRSRLVLDVPADMPAPPVVEKNLGFQPKTEVVNGRRVTTWAVGDLPRVRTEPFAADSNDVIMSIELSSPGQWSDVTSWYHGLAADRYALTPDVLAKLAEVTANAPSREDTIRAVHRWVAQDIRYVSVSLGLGGYQPRAPAELLKTGFGDCKDKATLFIAALRHMGIEAYPVLVNSGGGVTPELPSISQFDHLIAAVRTPDGYTYTDLTSEITPYGMLPYDLQGEYGVLVRGDGSAEEIRMPMDPVERNATLTRIAGRVSEDGLFSGTYEESGSGIFEMSLREAFMTRMDSTQRAQMTRNLATNYFTGASGDSLVLFDGKDLQAEARVTLNIIDGQAVSETAGMRIFQFPFGSMEGFLNAADELASRDPRRFPIDVSQVIGPTVGTAELVVELPAGWTARLPSAVSATSAFGHYASEYHQVGNELRITRTFQGARGVLPPDRITELIAWYREIGKDNVRFIVLEAPDDL